MIKKFFRTNIVILLFSIICIIISLNFFINIYAVKNISSDFEKEIDSEYISYNNPVFKIDKIAIYSNCHFEPTDDSNPSTLSLDFSLFSDIAIYLSSSYNTYTSENTAKSIYIDNVIINNNSNTSNLYAKSIYDFGKFVIDENNIIKDFYKFPISNNGINYDNHEISYDLKNPIILGYVNNKFEQNYVVSDVKEDFKFDGRLLKKAHITLNDLSSNISFDLHIINNSDEEYICRVSFPIELQNTVNTLYEGDVYYEIKDTNKYIFNKAIKYE